MASILQIRGLASSGKRLLGQIRSSDSVPFPPLPFRRVHDSVYDKNLEENVNPSVVPDHIIPPQPVEYWAPHPQTGVFGPASGDKKGNEASGGEDSVLQQTAFFRPLEDLEKPPVEMHNQAEAVQPSVMNK